MQLHRHFDLSEANALVPLVRETFARVRPLHTELQQRAVELVELGQEINIQHHEGPLPVDLVSQKAALHRLALQIHRTLRGIVERGVEVKGVDGLVDFRSKYCGRVVYLCWHWDEPEIHCFHELDGGFAGRRVIDDPAAFFGDPVN